MVPFPRFPRQVLLIVAILVGLTGLIMGLATTSAQQGFDQTLPLMLQYDKSFSAKLSAPSATIGALTPRKAGHSYLSLPSSAFSPAESAYHYYNYGKQITNLGVGNPPAPGLQVWSAAVHLPQDVRITQLALLAGDVQADQPGNRDGAVTISMSYSKLDELSEAAIGDIAIIASYPNTSLVTDVAVYSSTAALNSMAIIDNSVYAYVVTLVMPANPNAPDQYPNTYFWGARIEYEYPNTQNLPLVKK
ncbi:MAG: hypothetical protein H0T53_05390 [Herpetosiphonaceae bacterium]|nr:hypothetical protein [Herpetosiphonaceae bacterium]